MKTLLFVDACMRGPEQSRTYGLCRHFVDEYLKTHPEFQLVRRDLTAGDLPQLTGALADQREEWPVTQPDNPLIAPAKEVAGADVIVVGAPYWDLTFPAALKVYLEWASLNHVTFCYTDGGKQEGLSRCADLIFITTGGGPIQGRNFGYDYLKALSHMLGIRRTHCVTAEGLDVQGNDVSAILNQAKEELDRLARSL